MDMNVLNRVVEITLQSRHFQDEAYLKFHNMRMDLDAESIFELSNYAEENNRQKCMTTAQEYLNQLGLEREFILKSNSGYVRELEELFVQVPFKEKSAFMSRVLPHLTRNYELALDINKAKQEAVSCVIELLNVFNKVYSNSLNLDKKRMGPVWLKEIEMLNSRIDRELAKQERKAKEQRQLKQQSDIRLTDLLGFLSST